MINILIVEKDFNYSRKIINMLSSKNNEIRFCGITTTITETLEFIKSNTIDIILIGSHIMQKTNPTYLNNIKNSIIILSNYDEILSNTHYSFNSISKKDSISVLNNKINTIVNQNKKIPNIDNLKKIIENELIYLHYNPAYKGFNYLVETILILNNLDDYNLSKHIYPIVAEKFNTIPENVKYNIRNATEAMYYDCPLETLSAYLGFDISNKPGTKNIIFAVENNIRRNFL